MKNFTKADITKTTALEEAIRLVFGIEVRDRTQVLSTETMLGEVAEEYDRIGTASRIMTYDTLCEDFKNRTGCYGANHTNMQIGTIVDVGCGSGLLSIRLAEQTNGKVFGIDLSPDMLRLARNNLDIRLKEKQMETEEFHKKLPDYCKPKEKVQDTKISSTIQLPIDFKEGSIYALSEIFEDKKDINYVVCRNVLHRLIQPEKALKEMYQILAPKGKIYVRDLKRDADWTTIVNRIGEERWQNQLLVIDYLGAMAAMLTIKEVKDMLTSIGIQNYEISDGHYKINEGPKDNSQMKEYATEVEYVCVIQKA